MDCSTDVKAIYESQQLLTASIRDTKSTFRCYTLLSI